MPANYFNPRGEYCGLVSALVGSTDTINSSDVGRLVAKSSNNVILKSGGSSFSTDLIAGIIAAVPEASSGGSTVPIYISKLNPEYEIEGTYTTAYGGGHPATTDIGKYVGLSSAASFAGAVLDMQFVSNAPGTSNGCFLRISGFSTNRRKIYGYPAVNSSCLSW
jgi:hypothetical protein